MLSGNCRLLHVLGAATVRLPGQEAGSGGMLTHVRPEAVRHSDHAQRQRRRLGDAWGRQGHALFEAPGRLGIADVQRDWAPHALGVHQRRRGQGHGTAAQDAMGAGLGAQRGRGAAHDMQCLGARLGAQWHVRPPGLEVPRHRGRCEGWPRAGGSSALAARVARRPSPGSGAGVGHGERRLAPERGHAGYGALARPRPGVGMAPGAIQDQGGPRTALPTPAPQGLHPGWEPHQCWGERAGCRGVVRATGRTPWTTLGAWHERFFRWCLRLAGGLLRLAAHDLLHAEWARVPGRDPDQGQRAQGQPGLSS
jgi:hypothetical protein